jgi:hypothetical protein
MDDKGVRIARLVDMAASGGLRAAKRLTLFFGMNL